MWQERTFIVRIYKQDDDEFSPGIAGVVEDITHGVRENFHSQAELWELVTGEQEKTEA